MKQQLRESPDNLKEVVKIMCHTTCQGADRFHLLGLKELGFQHLALSHVSQIDDITHRSAILIPINCCAYTDRNNASVLGVSLGFNTIEIFSNQNLIDHDFRFRPVFLGDDQIHLLTQTLLWGPSENAGES